ncbi:S-Ena type endospore appendage [Priestia koreensis]|uniref:S-Ena type endospore appendage n=1 Tax=Priestia koreensis TaxID=284581 RepID=UPI003D091C51
MGCNSDYSSAVLGQCSTSPDYVKDQVCAQFSIATTEVIYEALNETVIASFVLKNTGIVAFTVDVENAAETPVITAENVAPGQVIIRTIDSLGTISITNAGGAGTTAKGDLDIVVRYTIG